MKAFPSWFKIFLACMIVFPSSIVPGSTVPEAAAEAASGEIPAAQVLAEDDFQDGNAEGWSLTDSSTASLTVGDDPDVAGNKLLYQPNANEGLALIGDSGWKDYIYEAKLKMLDNGAYTGILFRYTNSGSYYMFQLQQPTNKLVLSRKGTVSKDLATADFPSVKNKGYTLRVVVEGKNIKAYVDGKLFFDVTDDANALTAGKVGLRSRWAKSGIDDVKVYSIPQPKPVAPLNLAAGDITATTAPLSWDAAAGDAFYRVYRSEQGKSAFTQAYAGKANTFRDSGLAAETGYDYRITADYFGYESPASEIVTIKTGVKAIAPARPEVKETTASSIKLGWQEVPGAGKYTLYRASNVNGPFTRKVYSGTDTEATDSGLLSGVTYYYVLTYSDTYDESVPSAPVKETTVLNLPATPDLLPGIVARYDFNEGSGTSTADKSGGGKGAATLVNGAAWAAGHSGEAGDNAVNLDGTNDHVLLPAGIVKDLSDMTLSLWVNQDTAKKWARIFDIGKGESNYIFLTSANDGNETRFVLKNGGGEEVVKKGPAQQAIGAWMHYAVTLSGNTAVLYVNGEEVARNEAMTIKPQDLGDTTLNYIGRSMFSADPYFDGKIDDFYVFDRALAPAEVALFTTKENQFNVAADKASLTLGDTSRVMKDLILPTVGNKGAAITWESSQPEAVSHTGKVSRPNLGEGNAAVELTATLKQGNVTASKKFSLTVLEELTDADAVAADIEGLAIANADKVTAKLVLPVIGGNDTSITWKSDNERYLRPDGMVSRPQISAADLQVTLTATVKRGEVTQKRDLAVTILAQDTDTAYLFAYNKWVSGQNQLFYAVSRNGKTWTELAASASLSAIADAKTFKLLSEDKWYKYEYMNAAWSLSSAKSPDGPWSAESSFTLPAGALDGSFTRIDEAEWNSLVHKLSTPKTLEVLKASTRTGFPLRLPETVKVDYTNNLYANLPVQWDSVAADKYAAEGSITVSGTLTGTETSVQAAVTVVGDTVYSESIRNGEFWYDNEGAMIQAHGGHIIKVADTYYWFGEDKGHNSAVLKGVSIYASKDLKTWEYRNTALSAASHPELASSKIERPKVLYNAKTGKYVLWGHWEEAGNYNQANVVVAVSDTVDGEYTYINRFQPGGTQSRDFTVFQDDDGAAYLFASSNNNADMNVFQLTDDYLYVDKLLYTAFPGGKRESPAVVKKDGVYYMFTSGLSGWYPNQGQYTTTTNLKNKDGWSALKNFGDPATYYTQSSFIVSVYGTDTTSYIYVGDRWNPTELRNSQYIWLPLELDNGTASLTYSGEWSLDAATGHIETPKDLLISQGKPATASSAASGFAASAANDGNYESYFDSGSTSFPTTWRVDLEWGYDLSRIDLSWREFNGSEVYYQYKIEGSNDDVNYTTLVDQSANKTPSFLSHKLTGTYRYVKLTILGQYGHTNNADKLVTWYRGLHEVKIYTSDTRLDVPQLTATALLNAGDKAMTNVSLEWNTVTNATYYSLYRSEELNGAYERIHAGKAVTYIDTGLQPGTTYYYKVKADYAGGGSELSEAASAVTHAVAEDAIVFDNRANVWYDTDGNVMPIGSFLKSGDTWYYYTTVSDGFRFKEMILYTSTDFKNWTKQEQTLMDDQFYEELKQSKLEAMSVLYNEQTGKYVAWFHYENAVDYTVARVAAAVADSPNGPFVFQESFRPQNNDSRDLTTFKDDDGTAYLISSTNTNADLKIYKLTDDYLQVADDEAITVYKGKHREAPSMIKKDGVYYLFTSGAAGWMPTQGTYSTAASIAGPWTDPQKIGNASTFAGQSGGVLTLQGTAGTSHIMMANQWNPADLKTSKRLFLPLSFNGLKASYDYYDHVAVDPAAGIVAPVTEGELLSLGKPVKAADTAAVSRADYANDGNYSTIWTAANNTWPKWWELDLGEVYNLSNIQMSWFLMNASEGYHLYTVETSTDGIHYTVALDKMDNKRYGFTSDKLTGAARYVRVNLVNAVLRNNPNNWYTPQLSEVKVYGTKSNTPAGLRVEEAAEASATLSWDAVAGAQGYSLYRADKLDGGYAKVNADPVSGLSYKDAGLASNTTYYYKIAAIFPAGESALSTAVEAKTTIHGSPAGLRATAVTATYAALAWEPSVLASGYNIYRADALEGEYVQLNSGPLASPVYADYAVAAETAYYYKVAAVYASGESARSAAIEVRTGGQGENPVVPTGVRATVTADTYVDLIWNAAPHAGGYNVYRSESAEGQYLKLNAEPLADTKYLDQGTVADRMYYYKVTTLYVSSESERSAAVEVSTRIVIPLPAVPTALSVEKTTTASVTLSWKAVADAVGYHVYRSNTADGTYVKLSAEPVQGLQFTDPGLSADTVYYYKVTTVGAGGESAQTAALAAKTAAEPVTPVDPEKPVTPVEPEKPVEPVTPVNPAGPSVPTVPVNTGGSSSGSNPAQVTVSGSQLTVPVTVEANGGLQASIAESDVKKALEAASDTLTFHLQGVDDTTAANVLVTLPVQAILAAAHPVQTLEIEAGGITVQIPLLPTAGILAADAKQLELNLKRVETTQLPAALRSKAAGYPAFDIGLTVDGRAVSGTSKANALGVSFGYTLKPGEQAHQIVVYAIKDGKATLIRNTAYDAGRGTGNAGTGNAGTGNAGTGNAGTGNAGTGNAGQGNAGTGNTGTDPAGAGRISFLADGSGLYAAVYANVALKDLDQARWAQTMIETLAAREILQGTGADRFEPSRAVTRAEFLQMLFRALELPAEQAAPAANPFKDVNPEKWYAGVIAAAEKRGIVNGKANGQFGPDEVITREEMAVILARAAALNGVNENANNNANEANVNGTNANGTNANGTNANGTNANEANVNKTNVNAQPFKDQAAILAYAAEAVSRMQQAGLIDGFEDGSYQPQGAVTRAQAAAVIFKLLDSQR